jgi:hypothetical protein
MIRFIENTVRKTKCSIDRLRNVDGTCDFLHNATMVVTTWVPFSQKKVCGMLRQQSQIADENRGAILEQPLLRAAQ